MEANNHRNFARKLMRWFEKNKRTFPWRETRDPYLVLVAEILLRKTDAAKVSFSFRNFVCKYPNLEQLSGADTSELEKALRPLGLYRTRAKELKDLAEVLVTKHDAKVPRLREELLDLPGVGNYIANAVLCFAYGENLPLLDTNIIRIIERYFGAKSTKSRPRTDKSMWSKMQRIIPEGKSREFNLAMLDLGALICTSRNPKCGICPVANTCKARKEYHRKQGMFLQ